MKPLNNMVAEFTCVYCKQTVPFSPSAMRPHLTNPQPSAIAPSCMKTQMTMDENRQYLQGQWRVDAKAFDALKADRDQLDSIHPELIARVEALQAELHEVLRDAPYVYAKRQDSIRRLLTPNDGEAKQ